MYSHRTDNHHWRKIKNLVASTATFVSAVLVIAPLGLVFFHLLVNGASSVNWDFFTHLPKPVGEAGGGMVNAIVGSLELLALASIIGIPVGVLGGVYLAEYGTVARELGAAFRCRRAQWRSIDHLGGGRLRHGGVTF